MEGAPSRCDRVKWPFGKRAPERRQAVPFSDAVVAALAAQAGGAAIGDASAIAALEAAVVLYCRAFAAAKISPAIAALTPGCMALIARNLIRRGEDVHQLVTDGAAIRLQPIGSWDVRGGPREADWWYRVDEFGPSGKSDAPRTGRGRPSLQVRDRFGSPVARDRPARLGAFDREPRGKPRNPPRRRGRRAGRIRDPDPR